MEENMKISVYQQKQKELLREKAWKLYQEGLSLRQVGKALNKSHQWVADAIKHYKT